MQSNTSLDAFEHCILEKSDPLAIVLWKTGILQIDDLFYILAKRVERQNCYHKQSYFPEISQGTSAMLNGSLTSSLTNNGFQPCLQVEAEQTRANEFASDPSPALPFSGNQELLYMNKPMVINLTSEISVAAGHITNENSSVSSVASVEEGRVNDSIMQESADDVSVDALDSPMVEVGALGESRDVSSLEAVQGHSRLTPGVISSAFGDTGSPLSPTFSIPGTDSCPYCGHTPNRRYNLNMHILTHLEDRPRESECPVCRDSFYRPGDMLRHFESEHLKIRYVCSCGKKFTRKYNLKKHKQKENHQ